MEAPNPPLTYAFLTTTTPLQPSGYERGLIRRIVMRNFFERKALNRERAGLGAEKGRVGQGSEKGQSERGSDKARDIQGSEKQSEDTVRQKEKGGLRGRFRVVDVGKSVGGKAGGKGRKRRRDGKGEKGEGKGNGGMAEMRGMDGKRGKVRLRVELGQGRFDPFDVLPVPGTTRMGVLVRLCELIFLSSETRYMSICLHLMAQPQYTQTNTYTTLLTPTR